MAGHYKSKNVIHARHQRAMVILAEVAKENGSGIGDIVNVYRDDFVIEMRRDFCRRAHAAGVGSILIGKILNRSHSTVLYHINPRIRANKAARHQLRKEGRLNVGA